MKTKPKTFEEVQNLGKIFQGWVDGGRVSEYDQTGLRLAMTNNAVGIYTHRYAKTEQEYALDSYAEAVTTSGRGIVGEEPDWLKRILNVAYLGGHGMNLVTTPPDFVLWFETDAKLDLVRFVIEAEDLNEGE